ncbi:hypothetical protein BGX38DRAFT_587915 [Terfezia claveryi]|nr:hypothetical protein BGX38DRAFT_587915 [Terfezia claveryi]
MEAGQVRVTMAEVVHGSTASTADHHRVVFPWYMGIKDDHKMLDQAECGTWDEVASAHRDLLPGPSSSPSGYPHMYGSISAFGGCIFVRGVSPICDALVGARKNTDLGVLADVSCLLGEDRKAAKRKVKETRKVILQSYRGWYLQAVKLEQQAYGPTAIIPSMVAEFRGVIRLGKLIERTV